MKYIAGLLVGFALVMGEAVAQDNDELAFEFIGQAINTDGEVMYVAHECYDENKLTKEEFDKTLIHDTKNVSLDPRNYCEDLKKVIKGWK